MAPLKKIGAVVFYLALVVLGVLLYMWGLFYLFVPLAIAGLVVGGVLIWKQEGKKDKQRVEELYRQGILVKQAGKPEAVDEAAIAEIAHTISCGDGRVTEPVAKCLKNYPAYFAGHRQEYAERGIESIDGFDKATLCWLNMVDVLIGHGYAVEEDWKEEPEELRLALEGIAKERWNSIDFTNLPLDFSDIKYPEIAVRGANAVVTDLYLREMSSALKKQGCALGCIDIDSDSYVLFLTDTGNMEELENLAKQYGKRISFDFTQI